MATEIIEIAVKGKWFSVQALNVDGKNLVVRGNWLKVAYVNNEQWLQTQVEDPALCIKMLKSANNQSVRADIFTFSQQLPHTSPQYDYTLEWDSVAAVHVKSY